MPHFMHRTLWILDTIVVLLLNFSQKFPTVSYHTRSFNKGLHINPCHQERAFKLSVMTLCQLLTPGALWWPRVETNKRTSDVETAKLKGITKSVESFTTSYSWDAILLRCSRVPFTSIWTPTPARQGENTHCFSLTQYWPFCHTCRRLNRPNAVITHTHQPHIKGWWVWLLTAYSVAW